MHPSNTECDKYPRDEVKYTQFYGKSTRNKIVHQTLEDFKDNSMIKKLTIYSNDKYIFRIVIDWDNTGGASVTLGSGRGTKVTGMDCSNLHIKNIKGYLYNGELVGLKMKHIESIQPSLGECKDPPSFNWDLTNDITLTNIAVCFDADLSPPRITGIQFYYTQKGGPKSVRSNYYIKGTKQAFMALAPLSVVSYLNSNSNSNSNNKQTISYYSSHDYICELSWPALAILAHTVVVAKSLINVGKLRYRLAIKAPNCNPPLTTSPADTQLWYRTFRAQENCKEMFLIYLPTILIASTLGYDAFGKWIPRTVGTLAFAGAFFRYQYLNAYIEDADKRSKPFYLANICFKSIFLLAVLSAGYSFGKQLYYTAMTDYDDSSSEEEEKEKEEEEQQRPHQQQHEEKNE